VRTTLTLRTGSGALRRLVPQLRERGEDRSQLAFELVGAVREDVADPPPGTQRGSIPLVLAELAEEVHRRAVAVVRSLPNPGRLSGKALRSEAARGPSLTQTV